MAEKLCTLRRRGGGGTLKETTLWTNSAPSNAFSGTTVTLIANISTYDYIAVDYYITNALVSDENKIRVIMSVSDFKKGKTPVSNNIPTLVICTYLNNSYARRIYYSSETQILIGNADIVNASGSYNNYCAIPYQIIGLK